MPFAFSLDLPFFTKFERQFKVSCCLQLLILLLAALALDQGELFQWMVLAATAYWMAVAIIMIRRNGNATHFDQVLLTWGYLMAIVLTACLLAIVPMGLFRQH